VVEGREDFDLTRHAAFCAFGFAYLGGFQYWLYNVKFTQWCGPLTRAFGHRATAPIKTFIDQGIHHPFLYFPSFFAIKAAVSGQPLSAAAEKYRAEIWDSVKALWMVWVPAQVRGWRPGAGGPAGARPADAECVHLPPPCWCCASVPRLVLAPGPACHALHAGSVSPVSGATQPCQRRRRPMACLSESAPSAPSPLQFVNFAFVPKHLRIPYVAAVSFGWTVILSVMQGKFDAAIAQRRSLLSQEDAAAAAAAAQAAQAAAAAPPPPPSLLPRAAAAAVQHERAATAAQAPIVAAAVAEVPAGRSAAAAVEEA
jgi:hypothetical protein